MQIHLATEPPNKIHVDFFDSDRLSDYLSSDDEDEEAADSDGDHTADEKGETTVESKIASIMAELQADQTEDGPIGPENLPRSLPEDASAEEDGRRSCHLRPIKVEPATEPAECGLRDLLSPPTTLEELMDTYDATSFETFMT